MITNAHILDALTEVADILEIQGANRFRIRAYRNAVRTVEAQTAPLARWVAEGKDLTELSGIGAEMARHIREIVETGELSLLAELSSEVPRGLVELTRLPGVGPKKARQLWETLDIEAVDDLEAAAQAGKVAELPGFGARSQEKILAAIAEWREHSSRIRRVDARRVVEPLVEHLAEVEGVESLEVAGSYRRGVETVGDLDLLAVTGSEEAAAELMERFLTHPNVRSTSMAGKTRSSVRLASGISGDIQVDLRIVSPASRGAALVYFTGSKEHNVVLRQRALERGLTLSEYGLFEGDDAGPGADPGQRVAGASEEEVYGALELPWIPPELRENRGEIRAAAAGELPEPLVTVDDLRGDLQMHSTWSDGAVSIEEMLEACAARGYEYFALTDHSKALAMTGGLDARRLRLQWKEIDRVQARHPEIRLLKSLEVDILADGSLDMDDESLAGLDLVLVSVHSRFDLPAEEQTERILKAVTHPLVDCLAHPTGRIVNRRKPFDFDLDRVLEACADHGVAVELNASPERLDLKDTHLMRARELGVPITISTDAHHPRHLGFMAHGIEQARRAWLTPADVLNCRPLAGMEEFLARR